MTSKQALVVDDSRSARKVLERMLQKADVSVTTVEDAESALVYLRKEVPGIIFMDHMMPGMNGLEATSELRKIPSLQKVPTIMYTSKDDEDYINLAKAHGANDVLAKPAKQDKLNTIINLYLSSAETSTQKPMSNADTAEQHSASSPYAQKPDTKKNEEASRLDEQVILTLIQQTLNRLTPELQKTLQADLRKTLQEHQSKQESAQLQLEQKLEAELEQNKPNPSALFKTLQPVLQKLSLQVATKVVDRSTDKITAPLEEKLSEANTAISDLQTRQTQQHRHTSNEQRQLKLIAYSALTLSVISTTALVVSFMQNM